MKSKTPHPLIVSVSLWNQTIWTSIQVGDLSNILSVEKNHQKPSQPQTKPSMRRTAVTEEVDVVTDGLQRNLLFQSLF